MHRLPDPSVSKPLPGSNRFAVRLAVFYGAIFLVVGVFLPFFPVWLQHRQLSANEISYVLAAPMLIRIVFTPLIAFIADHLGERRRVLIALAWGSLAAMAAFQPMSGFWPLLAVAVLFGVFWTSVMPLTESIAMTEVKLNGLDYGRMRLWGSLTFILASFGGGWLVERAGAPIVLPLLIGALVLALLTAHGLPRAASSQQMAKAAPLPPIHWREAATLAHAPLFVLFLLTSAGVQATHAIYYGFGTLHWQSLHIPSSVIGALWATGVIAEVTLFFWSKPVVARLGPTRLLILAALGAILRWGLTAFDPPLWLLFAVQTLHALSFGAAHLGAIHFIGRAVPEHYSATGQGLYAAFAMGIIMGLMTMAAGTIYKSLGGEAYLTMALLALVALAGALLLHRKWHGGPVIGGGRAQPAPRT
jgi:PPP family 3-phenylpropionic acid transporter